MPQHGPALKRYPDPLARGKQSASLAAPNLEMLSTDSGVSTTGITRARAFVPLIGNSQCTLSDSIFGSGLPADPRRRTWRLASRCPSSLAAGFGPATKQHNAPVTLHRRMGE